MSSNLSSNKNSLDQIRSKDFLETPEGLIFAVVADDLEEDRVLTFLRYIRVESDHSRWKKLDTSQANCFLKENYPSYLYHSSIFDADLHAVPLDKIAIHHQATAKLKSLINSEKSKNTLQKKLFQLVSLLIENKVEIDQLGITGSFLIGAENDKSDIDLVIYDRQVFHKTRKIIEDLINKGKLSALDQNFWKDSYQRRSCSLTFEEYVWHEKRKYNKAVFDGIKFDLSLVAGVDRNEKSAESVEEIYTKKGQITITAEVLDDQYAFDTPCSYSLKHPEFKKVICFTPTYTGQAISGEIIEIAGNIEESEQGGDRRIIVGSSREAVGEYIKVIR